MARARNIKPSFFTDDELAEVAPIVRLLFIGLWTLADREGRLEDRPKRIKAELLPYDDADVESALSALSQRRFIVRYVVDGVRYIQVRRFTKHQNPHMREPASAIPAPVEHSASTVLALGESQPEPEPARLIPDSPSLIPDSPLPPTEGEGACLAKGGRPPDGAPAVRAKRIPDGFPADPEFAWCREHRPDLDPLRVGQVFRDHHLARGSAMKDWPAAWRTWIGRERGPAPRAGPTAADRRAAFVASITGAAGTQPDPRIIDVDFAESAPARLAIGRR